MDFYKFDLNIILVVLLLKMEVIYNSNYMIYPDGRVYSKYINRFLQYNVDNTGYIRLRINKKLYMLHRLVAIHYIPNPDNLPTVDHIDRNRLNNDVSNLRWADYITQNSNKNKYKICENNTSGHKHIYFRKNRNTWNYQIDKLHIKKSFKTKREALCYKFIMILKHNLH